MKGNKKVSQHRDEESAYWTRKREIVGSAGLNGLQERVLQKRDKWGRGKFDRGKYKRHSCHKKTYERWGALKGIGGEKRSLSVEGVLNFPREAPLRMNLL